MTKTTCLGLLAATIAVPAAVACGETQKPDPATGGSSGTTVVAHPPNGPVPSATPAAEPTGAFLMRTLHRGHGGGTADKEHNDAGV